MNVIIRPATAADSIVIGEIYYQAYQNLAWFQHVNSEADPNDVKAFVQSVVLAIQKQNGVLFIAEREGQAIGCLLGWERASDSSVEGNHAFPNPYYDPGVTVNIRGRVCSRWIDQQADIRKFSGQIGTQQGRFLCKSSVVLTRRYLLTSGQTLTRSPFCLNTRGKASGACYFRALSTKLIPRAWLSVWFHLLVCTCARQGFLS